MENGDAIAQMLEELRAEGLPDKKATRNDREIVIERSYGFFKSPYFSLPPLTSLGNEVPLSDCRECRYATNHSRAYNDLPSSVLEGERFIPRCKHGAPLTLLLTPLRLAIYPLPSVSLENPTQIVYKDPKTGIVRVYRFEGFYILVHNIYQAGCSLPLRFSRGGVEFTAQLLDDPTFPVDMKMDYDNLERLHHYLFSDIFNWGLWNENTVRHNPDHEEGCRRYHLLPRFVTTMEDGQTQVILTPEQIVTGLNNIRGKCVLNSIREYLASEFVNRLALLAAQQPNPKEFIQQQMHAGVTELMRNEIILPVGAAAAASSSSSPYDGRPGSAKRVDDVDFRLTPFSEIPDNRDSDRDRDRDKDRHDWDRDRDRRDWERDRDYRERQLTFAEKALQRMRNSADIRIDPNQPLLIHQPLVNRENAEWGTKMIPQLWEHTGIKADVCHIGSMLPLVLLHMRIYSSLLTLEKRVGVQFKNKEYLRLTFVHQTFQPMYGWVATEVRDVINRLCIPPQQTLQQKTDAKDSNHSRSERNREREADVTETSVDYEHYQRTEWLGDAVVNYLGAYRLYRHLPNAPEGELSHYRTGLVNNLFLAHIVVTLGLHRYILYRPVHELVESGAKRRKMFADVFEAFLGALYLDQGLGAADEFFARCLFPSPSEEHFLIGWMEDYPHRFVEEDEEFETLQLKYPPIKRYADLAEALSFRHVRLLAEAFAHPSLIVVGANSVVPPSQVIKDNPNANPNSLLFTNTNGSLEFIGDATLSLIVSRRLYDHFPDQPEGVLSNYRAMLVNNLHLCQVAKDLELIKYIRFYSKADTLVRSEESMLADSFEALLGAILIEFDIDAVAVAVEVTLMHLLPGLMVEKKWLSPRLAFKEAIRKKLKRFVRIEYKVHQEFGPLHMRMIRVGLYVDGELEVEAAAGSRDRAEHKAAIKAIERFGLKSVIEQELHATDYYPHYLDPHRQRVTADSSSAFVHRTLTSLPADAPPASSSSSSATSAPSSSSLTRGGSGGGRGGGHGGRGFQGGGGRGGRGGGNFHQNSGKRQNNFNNNHRGDRGGGGRGPKRGRDH